MMQVFQHFWPLSFIAFGGPNAHIAMFYQLFVEKLDWLSAEKFSELFSITQTLPGPGSTQMAYSIALMHSGIRAGLVQHLMWTLPGTFMMIGFSYGINTLDNELPLYLREILNGLTSSAVGLVALSAFKMGNTIISTKMQMAIATIVSVLAMCFSFPWLLPVLMVFGGVVSLLEYFYKSFRKSSQREPANESTAIIEQCEPQCAHIEEEVDLEASSRIRDGTIIEQNDNSEHIWHNYQLGYISFSLFSIFLIIALVLRSQQTPRLLQIWSTMYFVGSIIFGGGTVVIPALQQYVVSQGWLSDQEFLIGLALINAMPGN